MKKSNCGPRECFNYLSVDEDDLTVVKNEICLNWPQKKISVYQLLL